MDKVLKALTQAADGVFAVDREQHIVFWNTAAGPGHTPRPRSVLTLPTPDPLPLPSPCARALQLQRHLQQKTCQL
jgi:hypothetical protein